MLHSSDHQLELVIPCPYKGILKCHLETLIPNIHENSPTCTEWELVIPGLKNMYPHAGLWDLKPCCDLSPPNPLHSAFAGRELKVFSRKENGKSLCAAPSPASTAWRLLTKNMAEFIMMRHLLLWVNRLSRTCHIQNAGGTFPLLLPMLGSGNPYTRGQIITGYSSCTCITQDLGTRSQLLKRHSLMFLSLHVRTYRVHWEQTELCLSDWSLTYSCGIKEMIFFFKYRSKSHPP